MAVALSTSLSMDPLRALLQHLEPGFGQVILEGIEEICFVGVGRAPDHFHFDAAFDLARWERGRAFGEKIELRWRRRGTSYALLLISEEALSLPLHLAEAIGPLPEAIPLDRLSDDPPLHMMLWGSWQDPNAEPDLPDPKRPFWYEEQIPRFLAYPCDRPGPHRSGQPESRPAIRVARYRAPQDDPQEPDGPGDIIYRFVSVESVTAEAPFLEEGMSGGSREEEPR